MKKHDFGAWFLLCALLFLFAPGVSAMAEETKPLFAFAAQEEEVRPGGSFAVTCTPVRGDIGAFVLFADFDAEAIANAKAELPESVKSRHVYTSQQDGRFALVYTAKDGGALTEPFTLVFRTERGAEFDAVTVSFSVTDAANAVGQELIDTVQTTEKTFTYVKEPEIGAALLSLIPPTGTSSAAKGKDAASSEKLAESEVAEANVEEAPAETTVVTGEARDADLTRTEAEKNARAVQTDRLVTAAIVLLAVAFGFMLAVLWQRVSEKKGEKSGPRHGA